MPSTCIHFHIYRFQLAYRQCNVITLFFHILIQLSYNVQLIHLDKFKVSCTLTYHCNIKRP